MKRQISDYSIQGYSDAEYPRHRRRRIRNREREDSEARSNNIVLLHFNPSAGDTSSFETDRESVVLTNLSPNSFVIEGTGVQEVVKEYQAGIK